jgi:hypothetical protein
VGAGDLTDGKSVVERDGQRLLNHRGYAILSGDADGVAVFADGRIDEHGLRMAALDHVGFALVEEGFGEGVLLAVLLLKGSVCVGDADQLNFVVAREGVEKSVHMAVLEADNGDAKRGGIGLGGGDMGGGCEHQDGKKQADAKLKGGGHGHSPFSCG